MKYLGNIDLDKPLTLNGKPHGIEWIASLPTWSATDEGRVVYISSAKKLYLGQSDAWEELTEGNIGTHSHNDLYFTKTELSTGELDSRYFTESEITTAFSGKSDITHTHDAYAPALHNNTAHSETFITSSGVTYSALNANGAVGSGSEQVASGTHNHDLVYSAISHDHGAIYAAAEHSHAEEYAPIVHDHNLVYSVIGHDHNLAYASVSHNHDASYATAIHNHDASYATAIHNHDDLYFTESEMTTALSGKSDTTHTHAEYTPFATEVSGIPVDTPTVGTIRLDSDGTKLYVYTSTGWKQPSLLNMEI